MLRYRIKLSKDTNNTILVDVPAVPEAHTFGIDRADALRRAPDAIESAFSIYMEDRRPHRSPIMPAEVSSLLCRHSQRRSRGSITRCCGRN